MAKYTMIVRTDTQTPLHCRYPYANREIIVREPAIINHPKGNSTMVLRNASRILLAPLDGNDDSDNDIAYECSECGYVSSKPQGIIAHASAHKNTINTRYPEEVIRTIIRLMKYAKRHNITDGTLYIADYLNSTGVKTLNGERWLAAQVLALYNRWKDIIRVRTPSTCNVFTRDILNKQDTTKYIINDDDIHHSTSDTDDTGDIGDTSNGIVSDDATIKAIMTTCNDLIYAFTHMTRILASLNQHIHDVGPLIESLTRVITDVSTKHTRNITDKDRLLREIKDIIDTNMK